MPTGHSNTVLVRDLLSHDGPFVHVADNFVTASCAGCGATLNHDPRYGEWGAFCPACWPDARSA